MLTVKSERRHGIWRGAHRLLLPIWPDTVIMKPEYDMHPFRMVLRVQFRCFSRSIIKYGLLELVFYYSYFSGFSIKPTQVDIVFQATGGGNLNWGVIWNRYTGLHCTMYIHTAILVVRVLVKVVIYCIFFSSFMAQAMQLHASAARLLLLFTLSCPAPCMWSP